VSDVTSRFEWGAGLHGLRYVKIVFYGGCSGWIDARILYYCNVVWGSRLVLCLF